MSPKDGRGEVEKDGHPTFPSGGDAPLPDWRECGQDGRDQRRYLTNPRIITVTHTLFSRRVLRLLKTVTI